MKGLKAKENITRNYVKNPFSCKSGTYIAPEGTIYVLERLIIMEPGNAPRKILPNELAIAGIYQGNPTFTMARPYKMQEDFAQYFEEIEVTDDDIGSHLRNFLQKELETRYNHELEKLLK